MTNEWRVVNVKSVEDIRPDMRLAGRYLVANCPPEWIRAAAVLGVLVEEPVPDEPPIIDHMWRVGTLIHVIEDKPGWVVKVERES